MSEMRHDDVSSWTTDQVVFEFCQNDRPRWVSAGLPDIPAKEQLEEAIRSNHIDGSLLLELSSEDLKSELNIRSLGQRKAIEKAIRFLRGEPQPSATPAPFSVVDRARRTENWIPTPDNSRLSYHNASPAWETASAFPGRPSVEPSLFDGSPRVPNRDLALQPTGLSVFGPHPNSTPTLHPAAAARALPASVPPHNRFDAGQINPQVRPLSEPVLLQSNPAVAAYDESPVKTEAAHQESGANAGLLDNLEAHVFGDLQSSTNVEQPVPIEEAPKLTPTTQVTEQRKKRRIAPTLLGPVRAEDPSRQALQSSNTDAYLTSDALAMQDTFYGGDGDDEEQFHMFGEVRNPGHAMVVAKRSNKFLLSKPISIPGLGYSAVARIPYRPPSCIGPSRVYFTLFAQNALPSFQLLDHWPSLLQQVDSTYVTQKGGDVVQPEDAVSAFEDEAPSQKRVDDAADLGDFAYLLDKYPVAVDDENDALPAYGDSGDEGDYDEETWAEINAEKEEKQTKSNFLSREEAAAAVEHGIEDLRVKWRTDKLPKVQMKAYRLWMKVAKARRRQDVIEAQYITRNRKLAYLDKMKDHVLKDRWTSADQIKKQCESLEETLSQVLEAEHLLDVLHQNEAPVKPPPLQPKRASDRPVLQDDEEILESESEPEVESHMDYFVVDDDGDHAIPDDPADPDFDPKLPSVPRTDRSPAESSPKPVASEQQNLIESSSIPQEQPSAHEPAAAETPGNDADVSDSDSDSDAEEDKILRSTDKRRSMTKPARLEPGHGDGWSTPSQQAFDSDDDNSDMDAPSRLPPSKYKLMGKRAESPIELLSSDPARPEDPSTGPEYSVETPPLNTPDSDHTPKRKLRPVVLLKSGPRPSSEPELSQPDHDRANRVNVLISTLESCRQKEHSALRDLVTKLASKKSSKGKVLSNVLEQGLMTLHTEPAEDSDIPDFDIAGLHDGENDTAHLLTLLFISYITEQNCVSGKGYSVASVNYAFEHRQTYISAFQSDLFAVLGLEISRGVTEPLVKSEKSLKGKKSKATKRKRTISDDEDDLLGSELDQTDYTGHGSDADVPVPKTPHSKKKKKVEQSKEVRDTQKDDQQRVKEQEQRRKVLFKKMQGFGTSSVSIPPINAEEPVIMLDDHIAARVKPHQVNGIQFLWREIVSNPKHQGCLLAHTMGLGKTMQVISLLVTIAQARLNPDVDVVNQLPQHIQDNDKTLVLCPPSLLDNWYDELLMWTPPNQPTLLGLIIKITGGRSEDSSKAMARWASKGGVLIMSYDTFRSLLMPGKTKTEHLKQVEEYERLLLKTPSIVVADEAHKLKNEKSKISMVARRFTTQSRIALTGSPLNNHLEEYHTMVEWIAPNYLGSIAQFRSKYVDPITAGLYADSSGYERRTCLRKLHVLKKDLEPKVNRADITAIRSDMPPKTEYIITIPLADLQRKAYDLYVSALLAKLDPEKTAATSLFKWLNKLMILVNHPSCFIKLYEKYEELHQHSDGYESSTDVEKKTLQQASQEMSNMDNYDPLNVDKVSEFDSQSMKQAVDVFENQLDFGTYTEPGLSHRTDIALRILRKAVSVGDKTLVFSQSIATLDYLEAMLRKVDSNLMRIDGGTAMSKRQKMTRDFNLNQTGGDDAKIILISTKAGGLGLNLQGANRVILFDSGFNPMWEEQAVGRAYRLGQTTPVFVYRFKCGGTFEEPIYNKALFKTQLFQRVVDKKNPTRAAAKTAAKYLFLSKDVQRHNYDEYVGRDPYVLDQVLNEVDYVHNIELTETFQKDDGEKLNDEELKQANDEYEDELLRRQDPQKWQQKHDLLRRPALPAGPSGGVATGSGVGHSGLRGVGVGPGDKGSGKRPAHGKLATSKVMLASQTQYVKGQVQNLASADGYRPDEARERLTEPQKGLDLYGRRQQLDGANDSDSSGLDSVNIERITKGKEKEKVPEKCAPQ